MDIAAAMAQIKACMAAPQDPVPCVLLRTDGSTQEIVLDHRKIAEVLGGQPTVVGAIASMGVQAVMKQGAKKKSKHTFPEAFEPSIKGDVLLFRIGDLAEPVAFTIKEYKDWVDAGCPDEVEEEEEGEEMEGEEEDDDEEDEDEELEGEEEEGEEEEEDEEEEDLETFAEKFKAVPLAELKNVCQGLGVSTKGSKDELIAKLYAAAQAAEEEDDDDDDDDDDEEEEEEEEAPPPPPVASAEKVKAKVSPGPSGKAKVSPGPVKSIVKSKRKAALA